MGTIDRLPDRTWRARDTYDTHEHLDDEERTRAVPDVVLGAVGRLDRRAG